MPRILFALVGSLGDVYPFLALAKSLQCPPAGETAWEVVIVAHPEFENAVNSIGFTFAPLRPSIVSAIKETPQGKALTNSNVHLLKAANDFFQPLFKTWHQDIKAAHQLHKPDFVILSTFPTFCALFAIGDTPYAIMHTVPGHPSREIAPATAGLGLRLRFACLNRFVWSMGNKLLVKMYGDALSTLGPNGGPSPLPSDILAKDNVPIMHIYSSALLPRCTDWPAQCYVTGALSFTSPRLAGVTGGGENFIMEKGGTKDESSVEYQPPADLANLLEDAGKNSTPVVYVGFGSMLSVAFESTEAVALIQKIVSALLLPTTPKCLAIISTLGLSGTVNAPADSSINGTKIHFSSAFIPHSWLFPRCSVIVHHGGAGTTHAAIRQSLCQTGGSSTAAISVIIPCAVSSDQAFWGDIIFRSKLGPKPIPARSLTIAKFGEVLAQVLQPQKKGKEAAIMRKNAGEMAIRMKAEDGVAKAVEIIEKFALEKKVPGLV